MTNWQSRQSSCASAFFDINQSGRHLPTERFQRSTDCRNRTSPQIPRSTQLNDNSLENNRMLRKNFPLATNKALDVQPVTLCFWSHVAAVQLQVLPATCYLKALRLRRPGSNDGSNQQWFSKLDERTTSCHQSQEVRYLLSTYTALWYSLSWLYGRHVRLLSQGCPKRGGGINSKHFSAASLMGLLAAFRFQDHPHKPIKANENLADQSWLRWTQSHQEFLVCQERSFRKCS